jgi:hypothetical protein
LNQNDQLQEADMPNPKEPKAPKEADEGQTEREADPSPDARINPSREPSKEDKEVIAERLR